MTEAGFQEPGHGFRIRRYGPAKADPSITGAISGIGGEYESMLGMIEYTLATDCQFSTRYGRARHDKQHLTTIPVAAQVQAGFQEGRCNAASPSGGSHHAGHLHRRAEAVQAEKAEQLIVFPPQQVLHLIPAAGPQRTPLELQPAAVGIYNLPLELCDRLQFRWRKSRSWSQHRPESITW
jgi:hypothetical protein